MNDTQNSLRSPALLVFSSASALAILPMVGFAADHLDAPGVASDPSLDINDLYLFQSPTNPNNSVFIMTVNPFNGGADFSSAGSYQFQIDNTGDAVANVTYETTFAPAAGGTQAYTVTRNGLIIGGGTTGTTTATVTNGQVQAGTYDDPFFFDLNGFNNGFAFTGDDAFAGADVSAIVLEIDSSDFNAAGSTNVGAQARTLFGVNQFDRMGRPAVNTALVSAANKDAFNLGLPANDFGTFGSDVNASITGLSNAANANALTPILLPDLLTFDTSNPSGFLNGRGLTDDVIDATLNLVSAGAVTTDGVNANDNPFRSVFPFLALPNTPVPEPSRVLFLGVAAIIGLMRRRR